MSSIHRLLSSQEQSSSSGPSPSPPVQTQHPQPNDTGQVIFTRQLWERTMPDRTQSEHAVLNKSHATNNEAIERNLSESTRKDSSTRALRSNRYPSDPSTGSKTPLTPEEGTPFATPKKRSLALFDREDKLTDSPESTPAHTRANSGESTGSAFQVCICQPEPKIPRPRNAFILYRQHHQSNVVAKNPGLANPEISKIIGEQWRAEGEQEQRRWKSLAEEEKLRHQQQYPDYRYQPRRNNRRGSTTDSTDKTTQCKKCGGRTFLTPSAPSSAGFRPLDSTPGSAITPISQTLPVFRHLSLESPAVHRTGSVVQTMNMSPGYQEHRDDLGPLSPDIKRRRFDGDHPPQFHRTLQGRYGAPVATSIGPSTPFPFPQAPLPPHGYPPMGSHVRRESLPGLRGVVGPQGAMVAPRPFVGYQQHRHSQGHPLQDRSLTLPPLKTSGSAPASAALASGKSADEKGLAFSYRHKIRTLAQVAPPAIKSKHAPRGPLLAVEGDNPEAAKALAEQLCEMLRKSDDLDVKMLEGPYVATDAGREEVMAQYHRLAAEWLNKNKDILQVMAVEALTERAENMAMTTATPLSSPPPARVIDEVYDDSDAESSKSEEQKQTEHKKSSMDASAADKMDVDKDNTGKRSSTASSMGRFATGSIKPVVVIPNYSLYASNMFASLIHTGPNDVYQPNDHWQWSATLWRGVVGPDLTVYVRDAPAGNGPTVEIEDLEGRPDCSLFSVKRSIGEGEELRVEPSAARRVGFEVSEWVRAFDGS